jgi:hypothetical protein
MADKKNNDKIEVKRRGEKKDPMILSDMLYYVERLFSRSFYFSVFLFSLLSSCQYTHRPDDPIVFFGVVCVFLATALGSHGREGSKDSSSTSKTEDDGRRQYDSC